MARSIMKQMIGICQLTATHEKLKNIEKCKSLIAEAAARGCKMAFLPECFDYIGRNREETLELVNQEPVDVIGVFQNVAKSLKIWLSLGGVKVKQPASKNDARILNCHVIIDENGTVVANYRKLHLFAVDIPGQVRLNEGDVMQAGNAIHAPVETPIGRLGLSTCYDLRFAEQALLLRGAGAEILTYPSAFTQTTGLAHWEPLLRARAIETQCFVVAAAQTGRHNEKRTSFGHSMVVDPWGAIIAQCSEKEGLAFAEIDLNYLQNCRQQIPCENHRRNDVYQLVALNGAQNIESIDQQPEYVFGRVKIPSAQVFYRSLHSFAFVNLRPVVKGHVLIASLRPVTHLPDLTAAEVSDVFQSVQLVQRKLEAFYGVSSTTVVVQDGPLAGQTVAHLHVHILPRRADDFPNNDNIYHELQVHDKPGLERPPRSNEEMAEEAMEFRKLFQHLS